MFRTFNAFKSVKVAVFGDLMLDIYTFGKAKRVSPEAPVLILNREERKSLAGGAGNVALNLISLGAEVTVIGRIGTDMEGRELVRSLDGAGVNIEYVYKQKKYPTIVKHRVIADAHHLLRIDTESLDDLDTDIEEKIKNDLSRIIRASDAVAISDYGKGFLTRTILREIIDLSNAHDIPVIVDPKGADFSKYKGATMVKPNKQEAYAAAGQTENIPIEKVGADLVAETGVKMILVTRSSEGMSLFRKGKKALNFPAKVREVSDVTGAGDAVLAMVTLGLANRLDIKDTLHLSNIAGAIAVESLGCVRVTLADVAERLLEWNVVNKVFDKSHLSALKQVLSGTDVRVLVVGEKEEMSTGFLLALQEIGAKGSLILYVEGRKLKDPFVRLLSSLQEVDYIVLDSENLSHLSEEVHPVEIFEWKEGSLFEKEVVGKITI